MEIIRGVDFLSTWRAVTYVKLEVSGSAIKFWATYILFPVFWWFLNFFYFIFFAPICAVNVFNFVTIKVCYFNAVKGGQTHMF